MVVINNYIDDALFCDGQWLMAQTISLSLCDLRRCVLLELYII